MTVRQYPHTITIPGKAGESILQDGIWQTQPPTPSVDQACRYEPSPIAREITLADGSLVRYKGVVYLPLSTPDIENQVLVKVTKLAVVVVEAKTIYFYRGQMNCTLYL